MKNRIIDSIGRIDDDMIESAAALRSKIPEKKKISWIKWAAISATVCIAGGIGVYAASEDILFEDLFSNIHISDSELNDSVMGTVSDFEYTVSDDEYAVKILGVTGSSDSIICRAEIYRKDGFPVKDFFADNPEPENDNLIVPVGTFKTYTSTQLGGYFDENGNISLNLNVDYLHSLNGKTIGFHGSDIYYASSITKFEKENNGNIYNDFDGGINFVDNTSKKVTDISFDEITGLKLKWSFSFTYNQSWSSKVTKKCRTFPENFILNQNILVFTNERELETLNEKLECVPSKMDFSSVGGTIKFTCHYDFDFKSYYDEKYKGIDVADNRYVLPGQYNDMYLIKSDGSRIYMRFDLAGGSGTDEKSKIKSTLTYYDPELKGNENGDQIYTDISDAVSVYINGVTYDLK